ncbi:unnamed protein product [Effrenium voratum]|nr:unnamed protein product [Effrenium voratum]
MAGVVEWQGEKVFRTRFAELLDTALKVRARALQTSWPVPMAAAGDTCPLPLKLQAEERNMCPHIEVQFVPWGAGAIEGLTPLQHVQFALTLPHPACEASVIDPAVQEAIDFELALPTPDVDAFRQERLERLIFIAAQLEMEQSVWSEGAPPTLQPVVRRIHGPLWKMLLHAIDVQAEAFLRALQQGFPLVGVLPECEGSASAAYPSFPLSVQELRANRDALNQKVVSSLGELPHSSDILEQTLEDSQEGFMSPPRLLVPSDLRTKSLTRRIPVREERASGWRTRVVDHETESGINSATAPVDKIQHHSLDSLVVLLQRFMSAGVEAHMWKRDISKAFRRVPIQADHHDLAWTVWKSHGQIWVSQHFGMPFGTISAVYGWHRVGHMLWLILVRFFLAPANRYVDDYFGASRSGVTWSSGRILSVLSRLLGFPTDHSKDADATWEMVVLGASVQVSWKQQQIFTHVSHDKAQKYRALLQHMLDCQELAGREKPPKWQGDWGSQ